ncbi:gamma-aminobutyrate permease, partial [Staphylococcus felis]
IGVILNIVLPMIIEGSESIFVYVYSASILPGMIPWFMILFSHIQFRRKFPEKVEGHPFKMPLAPFTNYMTILFLIIVLLGMLINGETRVSVIIGFLFLGFMGVFFFMRGYHKRNKEDLKL